MSIQKKTFGPNRIYFSIDLFRISSAIDAKQDAELENVLKVYLKDIVVTEQEFYYIKCQLQDLEKSFFNAGCAVALSDLADDLVRNFISKKMSRPISIGNLGLISNRPMILDLKKFINELLDSHYNGVVIQINEKTARAAIALVRLFDELSNEVDVDQCQLIFQKAEFHIHDLLSCEIICSQMAYILKSDLSSIRYDSVKGIAF